MENLKRKGYVRAYGIGHVSNEEIGEYLKKGNVFSILMEMNIINSQNYNFLRRVKESSNSRLYSMIREVKIIPFSITARGLLTGAIDKNTMFQDYDIRSIDSLFNKERMNRISKLIEYMKKLAMEQGCSIAQLVISWVINKEGVWKALTGPTKIEHLKENIKALDINLDKRVMKKIDEFMESENDERDRRTKKWIERVLKGQPSNDVTEEIKNLIFIIDFYIDNGKFNSDLGMQLFSELIYIKNNRFDINNDLLKLRLIKEQIRMNLED
ncbi:aldo/keto reductase [Oceanirhabdus seepicola]|uniref:Aldo/keto reductase n=1 Tax=Oceanirhabdus seepicola TaxID=2828781 RepID=A0A9J6P802_9CLOT|nr:aldo/keto reductase [Oceanirhabdus seepicola]MCM1992134.1 aldo/keto reductase [Oceanirhabdus seepicola]